MSRILMTSHDIPSPYLKGNTDQNVKLENKCINIWANLQIKFMLQMKFILVLMRVKHHQNKDYHHIKSFS